MAIMVDKTIEGRNPAKKNVTDSDLKECFLKFEDVIETNLHKTLHHILLFF